MKIKPLHDRIIVRRAQAKTKTAGGIIIPDAIKEKPSEGEVLAVGNGRYNDKGVLIPLSVKVGDKILFHRFAGDDIQIDGENLLMLREDNVMAVEN